MTNLSHMKETWEGLADVDAFWAILSDPVRKDNAWTLDEFMQTGELEIDTVMQYVESLGLNANSRGSALDFGCGAGRLTQALTRHFDTCVGIDISPRMISLANTINTSPLKCRYYVNDSKQLKEFDADHFSFIYSSIVLQHMDRSYSSIYISELIRVLKPGGIFIFQVPDRLAPSDLQEFRKRASSVLSRARSIVRLRTRSKKALAALGLLRFNPDHDRYAALIEDTSFGMHCIRESEVRGVVYAAGAIIRDTQLTNSTDSNFNGQLIYLATEPTHGYISKQYCVVKPV